MIRSFSRLPRYRAAASSSLLTYHPCTISSSTPSRSLLVGSRRHASSNSNVADSTAEFATASESFLSTVTTWIDPFHLVHDVLHIPWLVAIPLVAALLRGALYKPVTLATRQAMQRKAAINTLILARRPNDLEKVKTEVNSKILRLISIGKLDRSAANKLREKEIKRGGLWLQRQFRTYHEVNYKCNFTHIAARSMLQFPLFVTMSLALRSHLGLPGNTWVGKLSEVTGIGNAASSGTASGNLEPGMMAERLLWAADATAADPYGIMSYGVACIVMSQTLLHLKTSGDNKVSITSLILLGVGFAIGPLMVNAPAGILWYWASSSGMALGINYWLQKKYPIKIVRPCKRPVVNPEQP